MATEDLASYLNDHLAGSVTALELFDFLIKKQEGTAAGQVLTRLREEVAADRRELEALMLRLDISQSRTRKATAYLGEKFSELKLRGDDPSGNYHLLQTLDVLSAGIEGKALLWRALAAAAQDVPALQVLKYDLLIERAETQRNQVEELRIAAARAALGKSG
ncbi:hypothetical protein [Geobacter sp. DSM 9736]|uniref:hypothetical protein n=1 Tax=Geobacter sp. DSM 9736 TaxID=1277350 RepID=UPI000B50E768|nr:hypothetical protein [Geobacter sp. DSM 9736]SNB45209.1 hypothetical protein SAMN06269301_0612 [Geobacter sp. DSM 9736]